MESNHSRIIPHANWMTCDQFSGYTGNERVTYGLLGGALSLYITIVNTFLFIVFIRDRRVQRIPGHMIIVSLMVTSDILIGLFALPGYLVNLLCHDWHPYWLCDLWITLDYTSTNVSMISVTTVAFDRFLATNCVFIHKRWMHRANQKRLAAGLWMFTMSRNVAMFPMWAYLGGYRNTEYLESVSSNGHQCNHPIYNNAIMGMLQRTIALYIPLVLLFFFYGAVVYRILQSESSITHIQAVNYRANNSTVYPSACSTTATPRRVTQVNLNRQGSFNAPLLQRNLGGMVTHGVQQSNSKRVRKSFRIVTCVMVSFLVSNLPWHIVENLRVSNLPTKWGFEFTDRNSIYVLFWIMTYMNAFLNPIFYWVMHQEYKSAICRWLNLAFCPCLKARRNGYGHDGQGDSGTLSALSNYMVSDVRHSSIASLSHHLTIVNSTPQLNAQRRSLSRWNQLHLPCSKSNTPTHQREHFHLLATHSTNVLPPCETYS